MNYIIVADGLITNVIIVNEPEYEWANSLGFIADPQNQMSIGDSYVDGVWTPRDDDTGN